MVPPAEARAVARVLLPVDLVVAALLLEVFDGPVQRGPFLAKTGHDEGQPAPRVRFEAVEIRIFDAVKLTDTHEAVLSASKRLPGGHNLVGALDHTVAIVGVMACGTMLAERQAVTAMDH